LDVFVIDGKVMEAAALVSIARAEDDDFHSNRSTYVAAALLPGPISQGSFDKRSNLGQLVFAL
jgi:hypothetical protein